MDDDFGLWDVFVSMFWFMLLFAWIWMIIAILTDIFRDRDSQRRGQGAVGAVHRADPVVGRTRSTSSPAATR